MTDADSLRILSAGAPKTGVRLCAEAFAAQSGAQFSLTFATAPVIRQKVTDGTAAADVVVAPSAVMADLQNDGKVVDGSVVDLGAVTSGVAVRNGAREPDLSSVAAFTQALLDADRLIFNQASSGQYIEKLLRQLGVDEQVRDKVVRTKTGAEVMQYLAADEHDAAIGFGQITEIRLNENLGVHLVGPLPDEISKVTVYQAAVLTQAEHAGLAAELARFMLSKPGKALFASSGVV